VDCDRSYLAECILGYQMSIGTEIIATSRLGTIGQDKVEATTCTIFVVFKANELIYCSRLEPLLKDFDFSWKLKEGSAFFIEANNL
jgi:hypothetical protein